MSDGQVRPETQHFGLGPVSQEIMFTFRTSEDLPVEQTTKGTHILRGLTVFRAGVFKDSRGIERTWTVEQLAQIAANYAKLRDDGTFPDVPVRSDHTASVKDVVGYFVNVYVDPSDPTYLLADIEFTEPDAYAKWHRGTYRSRSLEVGPYERNGEDGIYTYPTVLGLAFVDIGAVEGLHRRELSPMHFSQFIADGAPTPAKDITMNPEALKSLAAFIAAGGTADGWIAACNHAKQVDEQQADHARQQQEAQANFARACHYASAVEAHKANAQALDLPTDYAEKFSFSINGQPTQDFAAAQRHITALETAAEEVSKGERTDFVKRMVTEGKLLAAQEVATQALVDTFTPAQFGQYRTTMEAQPGNELLANHGAGGPQGGSGSGTNTDPAAPNERETLIETIAQFRRMDKSEDFIKGTKAYGRLVILDPTQAIS